MVSTLESATVLEKILYITNDVFCIIVMNWHDALVYFWRWKTVIKVWVNMLELFFSDQVIIFLFIEFVLLNLIVLHVVFLCTNKVRIFMGMFHKMNMFIGVIKVDWVNFWMREIKCSLRRACIFGCICFKLKSFGCGPYLWLFWSIFSLGAFAC